MSTTDIYATLVTPEQRKAHFDTTHHIVVRGLADHSAIDALLESFERDVKPYKGKLKRFLSPTSSHRFNSHGHIENHIEHIQRIEEPFLQPFVNHARNLMYSPGIQRELVNFFPDAIGSDQYIFFDVSSGISPHQDGFYAPDHNFTSVWIALEDIAITSGPLYAYPSATLPVFGRIDNETNSEHLTAVEQAITNYKLTKVTPIMRKGDVTMWRENVIHGSEPPTDPSRSRKSLVARFYRSKK